mmetsp:Transcript_37356/g.74076  ORF Transcript_37356/g.74076 Transcript_37356/m.74076 type:complete len:1029 (+) Transcript_37356:206-3292(+)
MQASAANSAAQFWVAHPPRNSQGPSSFSRFGRSHVYPPVRPALTPCCCSSCCCYAISRAGLRGGIIAIACKQKRWKSGCSMWLSLVPFHCSKWKQLNAVQTVVGTRRNSRTCLNSATAPSISTGPVEGPLAEEASWMRRVRHGCRTRDFVSVARTVLSMANSKQADAMQCLLSDEALRMGAHQLSVMLHIFEENNVAPHHAVQIWRMTQAWFRRQAPSIYAWTSILQALVVGGFVEEALEQVRAMEVGDDIRLPMPSEYEYTLLMPVVGELYGTTSATSLTSRLLLRGTTASTVHMLVMSVVNARAEPPNLDAAKLWLSKAEARSRLHQDVPAEKSRDITIMCYNTLMSGYFRQGMLKEGFSILGCMRARGRQPDSVSFQILMHACMQQSAYGIQECRQLLRVMQQMDIQPTTANYNILIEGYAKSGQLTSALRVANRMRDAGVAWDCYTYLFLMCAVNKAGQVEVSLRLLSKMRQDGVRPSDTHYIMAFVGLAEEGFYEDACRVFRRLESIQGLATQKAYNVMIAVHCMRGDMDSAAEVRQTMQNRGFPSDVKTFRTLLAGYIQQGLWDSVLDLQDDVFALRKQLRMLEHDKVATPAARAQATVLLKSKDWNTVFDILIDTALQNGEWTRAVNLLETMMDEGLPADTTKYAHVLQDGKLSHRIKQHLDLSSGMHSREPILDPDLQDHQSRKVDWVQRLPWIVQKDSAKQTRARVPQKVNAATAPDSASELVPAHVLCASLSPEWLDRAQRSSSSSSSSSSNRGRESGNADFLSRVALSRQEAFRRIHDFHHATMHRRPIISLSLLPQHTVIGRSTPETVDSLQELFETFGTPGLPRCPVYVFLRPVAAELDALLMLFSLGASHPAGVILLRSEEAEGVDSLTDECRARGDQPLSDCITSTLNSLPVGVVLNSTLLVANGTNLLNATPWDFETTIGATTPSSEEPDEEIVEDEEDDEEDGAPATWTKWLQKQQLQRIVRCEKGTVRLDAVAHQQAMSKDETFRARVLDNRDVAVDLWLTDELGVPEFD